MIVGGGHGGELVNEGNGAQVDGLAGTNVEVAARGDGHVVVSQGFLVLIGDVVAYTVVGGQRQLGNGNHHVEVGSVHAIEDEGVLTVLYAGRCQSVDSIVVQHVEEVAVVIQFLVGYIVALVVVQREVEEVIPAGDDNASLVGPSHEHVVVAVGGLSKDDIGERVAVLVLRHLIGIAVLAGGDDLLVNLVALLVGEYKVEDVGLGHVLTCQVVERRSPVEHYIIYMLGGSGLGCSLQVYQVDTHAGCIVLVIGSEVGSHIAGIGELLTVNGLVGVLGTAVIHAVVGGREQPAGGPGGVLLPVHQAVVGDEDVHARHRLVLGAVLASHREVVLLVDDRHTVVDHGIELATDHLGIEVGDL